MTTFNQDADRFFEITNVKLVKDGLLSAITGSPVVDVVAVDVKIMHRYSYRDCSMNEFLIGRFGEEAVEILNRWS